MHRPHRSIEVFDISLMAVVTKAMGAFLVLMLLLMPYYSSGSLGDKSAADAAKALAEAQNQLKAAMEQLANRSPEDLAKLLEETRWRLEEAQRFIAQLKRDNDALNAQARRLDADNSELRDKLAKFEADAKKILVNGYLINWDCTGVRIELAIMAKDEYIKETKDHPKLIYLLNHDRMSIEGETYTITDDEIIAKRPDLSAVARGHGYRFDQSNFNYAAAPGTYYLVLATKSKSVKKIDGWDGRALTRVASDCRVLLGLNYYVPGDNYYSYWVRDITISNSDYAVMPAQLSVTAKDIDWQTPSAEAIAWLHDQIDHAEKETASANTASEVPKPGISLTHPENFGKD